MLYKSLCVIAVLVMFVFFGAFEFLGQQPAQAAPVSTRNPFKSFNISGINYGSMQWEQQHRQKNYPTRRGRMFRRR